MLVAPKTESHTSAEPCAIKSHLQSLSSRILYIRFDVGVPLPFIIRTSLYAFKAFRISILSNGILTLLSYSSSTDISSAASTYLGHCPANITLPPAALNFSSISSVVRLIVMQSGTSTASYSIAPTANLPSVPFICDGRSDSLIKSKSIVPNSSHSIISLNFLSS